MGMGDIVINQVKSQLMKKLDAIKAPDGHPAIPEILGELEAFEKKVEALAAKIQPSDFDKLLAAANQVLENRFTADEIAHFKDAVMHLLSVLSILEKVGVELAAAEK